MRDGRVADHDARMVRVVQVVEGTPVQRAVGGAALLRAVEDRLHRPAHGEQRGLHQLRRQQRCEQRPVVVGAQQVGHVAEVGGLRVLEHGQLVDGGFGLEVHRGALRVDQMAQARQCGVHALQVLHGGALAHPVVPPYGSGPGAGTTDGVEGQRGVAPEAVVAVAVEEQTQVGEGGGAVQQQRVAVLGFPVGEACRGDYALSLKRERQTRDGSASRTGTICCAKSSAVGASCRSSSTTSTWEWFRFSKRRCIIAL